MRNVKQERDIEERCAAYMKKMETRIVKLEEEMLKKVDYEQITKIVETVISANPQPIAQEGASKLEIELVDKKISEIRKSVEDQAYEIRDSTNRERNIIIHGLKENDEKDPTTRKINDTKMIDNLMDFLGIEHEGYESVIRLGKKSELSEKPRPTRVIFRNTENKKTMLKNLHKLKNMDCTNVLSKIGVTHDMTKAEREQNKELIELAKEKSSNDNSGKFHFLVRGPPWARKIVKVAKKD
ncbi:hypothetical protein DPMN_143000 [Dreissena polymorpha]|uniref:Uncharacterized protein n=2 Tax=Dreissena polymorpha TaxID=45954 RepID=A0A9D4GFD9_DREPO|nr:hypothetical protein DPMN_143000 [Dreissena polymorpha]